MRAHREDHPLQQSRVARSERGRGERRGERGERQAKQAFAATAGSNSTAGAKIRSRSLDSGLLLRRARRPNRWRVMERMGERRGERNKSMRLFFSLHCTVQTLPLSQCHPNRPRKILFSQSSLCYCKIHHHSPASFVSLSTVSQ